MKLVKKRNLLLTRKFIVISSVLLVIAAASAAYLYSKGSLSSRTNDDAAGDPTTNSYSSKNTKNYASPADNKADDSPTDNSPNTPDTTANINPSGDNPPEKPTITRLEESGDYVRISAIFNNSSTGSCKLTMENDKSSTVVREASIVSLPNYNTCDGFRIPLSQLRAGVWDVTVTHLTDGGSSHESRQLTVGGGS